MRLKEALQIIRKYYYYPKYSGWIFIFLLLAFSVIYKYQNILFQPPQSIHQWRQCDCLSITMNYCQDDNPFFRPSVHYLGRDGTGKTISDFPLLYYSVGKLWKVFGHHEFIYRLIVLLFFFSGLFILFRIFENILKDSVIAILSTLYLFTSPTLAYYANNFLMDIPAFSLAVAGLFFFLRFTRSSATKDLCLSASFYAIAGLLKISSLLSFFAIGGLFLFELLNMQLSPGRRIFQHPLKQGFVFLGVLMIQLIWYLYAYYYNSHNNSGIFLVGTLPVWDLNRHEIKMTFDALVDHIKWNYFRRETQLIFVLMFPFILVFYKKVNRLFLFLTILLSVGFLSYIILFFGALRDHDYYTINLFIVVPVLLLSFFLLLRERFNPVYSSLLFRIIVLAFLIHNLDFAKRRMDGRYDPKGWQNREYITKNHTFNEIPTYLTSVGIKQDDRVISISDNSINISLYLMNRKGWTNYGLSSDSSRIREKIDQGAKYLLIYKNEIYNEKGIQPFLKKKIGEFGNIDIYGL
jgi:hypothetical protein